MWKISQLQTHTFNSKEKNYEDLKFESAYQRLEDIIRLSEAEVRKIQILRDGEAVEIEF